MVNRLQQKPVLIASQQSNSTNCRRRLADLVSHLVECSHPGRFPQTVWGDAISSPYSPTVPLPFVATRDVGEAAAESLLALDLQGRVVRELQGERDLNFLEATAVIGRILNRPGLHFVQIALEQAKQEWRESGMSANVIDLMAEVVEGINSRGYHVTQARDARTSTPTSLERFVEDVFVPHYEKVLNSMPILRA